MREVKSLMQKWTMDFQSLRLNLAHQPQGIVIEKGEVFVALVQQVLARKIFTVTQLVHSDAQHLVCPI